MGMENKDLEIRNEAELKEKIKNAIESGDSEAFAKVQVQMAKEIENRILKDAKESRNQDINDQAVMINRGLNPLTAEETKYYNEVIGSEGFAGTEDLMPPTIFDRVFDELRKKHPLLNLINFQNTTAVSEWITRNEGVEAAWWGALTAEIQKKLTASFKKEKTELFKLSAYIPVAKAMLKLGPQWLDRFVREILFESMAIALEMAIVDGTGKTQPIGMNRDLAGAVVDGVYPVKSPVELLDFDPSTLGKKIMASLTKQGERAVSEVLILVNPLDYWEKIFPKTTFLTADKTYVYGVLPIPAKLVQSVAVEKGTLIAGMAKDYFMGVGSTQKIEFSDHYKFLEDERTYIAKQYANGKPIDNDSFLLFDISNMEPVAKVKLKSLTLGSLTLDPLFDNDETTYTTTTTDSTNKITAVAEHKNADILIEVDDEEHENGTAFEWEEGANVVKVTVNNESNTKVYTVTVTKE